MLNTKKLEKRISELEKRVGTLEYLSKHKPLFKDGSKVGDFKIVNSRLEVTDSFSYARNFWNVNYLIKRGFVYTCYDKKHNVVVAIPESGLIEIEEQNKKKHE